MRRISRTSMSAPRPAPTSPSPVAAYARSTSSKDAFGEKRQPPIAAKAPRAPMGMAPTGNPEPKAGTGRIGPPVPLPPPPRLQTRSASAKPNVPGYDAVAGGEGVGSHVEEHSTGEAV